MVRVTTVVIVPPTAREDPVNSTAGSRTCPANGRSSAARRNDDFPARVCETWPLNERIQHIARRHHTWLLDGLPEIARLIRRGIASEEHTRPGSFAEIEKLFRQFQRETGR